MEVKEVTQRCRMNIKTTAKGEAQWDITAEYASPEEAAKNLDEAIDKVRKIISAKGLTEAGA